MNLLSAQDARNLFSEEKAKERIDRYREYYEDFTNSALEQAKNATLNGERRIMVRALFLDVNTLVELGYELIESKDKDGIIEFYTINW